MNIFRQMCLLLFKPNNPIQNMSAPEIANTALLVHIEHSKPIPVKDFASTMESYGNLYASFVRERGLEIDAENTGLFVEKIEHNCIDIYLCELVRVAMLPFAENINTVFEFGKHIKEVIDYFKTGRGQEPKLSLQELKDLKEIFSVTAGDQEGHTEVSVIDTVHTGNTYNNCTFNFGDSNSAQNQISKKIAKIKEAEPEVEGIQKRVLMTVHQHRNDDTGKGNKAIIDAIIKKKPVNLLFDTDELRDKILRTDENPTKRAFQVDVEVQTSNDKIVAYKVIALHETIEIED